MATEATVLADRYSIEEQIGEGATGRVFKGRDLLTEEPVAVKLLHPGVDSTLVKRESELLSGLNHPGVVKTKEVYDRFLVMPLVDGKPLNEFSGWGLRDKILAAVELLKILEYIHSQGVVHGDLKPSNILVRDRRDTASAPELVLTDFGVARVIHRGEFDSENLLGTIPYIAPEVIRLSTLDERSDLYSTGIVLHELFSGFSIREERCWRGRIPSASPVYEMLVRHLEVEPVAPSRLNRSLPEFLDDILLRLLQKDPDERFQSAGEVLEELTFKAGLEPYKRQERIDYGTQFLREAVFINREQELDALREFLSLPEEPFSEDRPRPHIAFVMGARGIGRTSLLLELQRTLLRGSLGNAQKGYRFYWCRCQNPQLEFHAISQLVKNSFLSISSRDRKLAEELAELYCRSILVLVPELGSHPLLSKESSSEQAGEEDTRRLAKFFLDYMLRLSSAEPVALVIDSANFVDPLSAEVLEHLARLIAGESVRVIVLCDESEAVPLFEFAWEKSLKISLSRLSESQCVAVLNSVFGKSVPRWHLDERLIKLSRGNPSLLLELVRELVRKRALYRRNGVWHIGEIPAQIQFPRSVTADSVKRFDSLGALQKEILLRLSVSRFWTSLGLLKKLLRGQAIATDSSSADDADLLEALERLHSAGFISVHFGTYIMSDETLRSYLYESIPARVRRELHSLIVKELEREPVDDLLSEYLAYHYLALDNEKKALTHLLAYARRLKSRYLHREAELQYRKAISLLDSAGASNELRVQLLIELAEINHAQGDLDESVRLYESAMALDPPRSLRGEILYRLAEVHRELGDFSSAVELAEKARHLTPTSAVERSISILTLQASIFERCGDLPEARSLLEEAFRLLRSTSDFSSRLDVLLNLALVYSSMGLWERAMEYLNVAFRIVADSSDPYLEAKACAVTGRIHYDRANTSKSAEYHLRSLDKLEESGHLLAVCAESNNLGLVYHERGDYSRALRYYLKALRTAQTFGELDGLENLYANLSLLYLDLDRIDRAEEANRHGLALAKSRSQCVSVATHLAIYAIIQARREQRVKALDALSEAVELSDTLPPGAVLLQCHYRIGQAYIELGELGRAEKVLARAQRIAEQSNSHRLKGLIAKLRGKICALRDDFSQSASFLHSAVRTLQQTDSPKELADAYFELGSLLLENAYDSPDMEALWEQGHHCLDRASELYTSIGFHQGIKEAQKVRDTHIERSGLSKLRELEEERKKLLRLQEINKALNSELELRKLLEKIMDAILGLVNAERGFILLLEDRRISIEIARNLDQESISRAEHKFSHSIAQKVIETGEPVISTDAQEDERFNEYISVHNLRLRSVCCIPLLKKDRIIGAFYIDNRFQKGAFIEKDVELLRAFADQAAIAIENARLYEQLLQKQQELQRAKEVQEILNRKLEQRLQQEQILLKSTRDELDAAYRELGLRYDYSNIVAASEKMRQVFQLLDRIIDTDVTVLIQGERGTGKELIARAIHFNGPRKRRPFIAENCSAFPPELLESELFGHVRGAFTGATADKKGLFELADGGTLFLDEISDMSLQMQAKLLRVIEEGIIRPLGGQRTKRVNVRLISASNRDLKELVAQKVFRADLYDRICVVTVTLPPLRERREDIPLLVDHFLKLASEETGKPPRRLHNKALTKLLSYPFPGNVRELENILKRAVLLCPYDEITPEYIDLPEETPLEEPHSGMTLKDYLDYHARTYIERILRESSSKTEAAQRLGIERTSLYKLLRRHGIEE